MKQKNLETTKTTVQASREVSDIAKPVLHPMLQLQADIGNRATSDLIYEQSRQNAAPGLSIQAKPMFGGLSRELLGGNPIQAKLTLGAVGDKYEQEADRVAAEVTSRLNRPSSEVSPESQGRPRRAPPVQATSPIQKGEAGAVQRWPSYKKNDGEREETVEVNLQILQAIMTENDLAQKDKKLRGKIIDFFRNQSTNYDSRESFIEAVKEKTNSRFVKKEKSKITTERGEQMEKIAADLLGGHLNKSGKKDLEWRAIPREEANRLKELKNYSSDLELMQKLNSEDKQKYGSLTSTPVDVYGTDFLCLVGGRYKFDKQGKLNQLDRDRIKELETICTALKYQAILAFNGDTTPRGWAEGVKREFVGMRVVLLVSKPEKRLDEIQ